tara:strand:+ start:1002 stop:1400 length:399 start_codon:yes stop_codon:yes gene_type:complete
MKVKKGTLVKARPGTVEGDAKKLGIGIVIKDSEEDEYGMWCCWVQWISRPKPWFSWVSDLEILNNHSEKTVNKTTELTVNISEMTKEELQSFLSGDMSWEDAVAAFPGGFLTISEVEADEFSTIPSAESEGE